MSVCIYGKRSKISNTSASTNSADPERRSSLIWVFPVCYSDKHFVNSSPEKNILFEKRAKCSKLKYIYHSFLEILLSVVGHLSVFEAWPYLEHMHIQSTRQTSRSCIVVQAEQLIIFKLTRMECFSKLGMKGLLLVLCETFVKQKL